MLVGLVLQPLTVLGSPCALFQGGQAAGLAACPAGPGLTLLAAKFGSLGLLTAAAGLMVMPGMRLNLAEAKMDRAAAASRRARDAQGRPRHVVPTFAMPLALR